MTAALPLSPVISWLSVGTMTALTAPSPQQAQASLASENRLAGAVALSSFRDTTLQWSWVAPLDRTQPGPGCWRSEARFYPCNVASSLEQKQLSARGFKKPPSLTSSARCPLTRVAPITPCPGYRSVRQRFLSSPGCHLWQQAKSGESFPLMPTRSEQLSHLPVPPQEASLAATNPVGTGPDPTNKTAVASGSCIVKVLDALCSNQSITC
jgi:hypothetical protein